MRKWDISAHQQSVLDPCITTAARGNIPALLISALALSAVHMPTSVIHAVAFVVVALVLGLLWLRTQSLLAGVVAHAAYNAIVLVTARLLG